MGILLVLASQTGNTKTFVEFLQRHSEQNITVCSDFDESIKDYNQIAFGSYTWGDGKIPTKMKKYLIDHQHELAGKDVLVFGSGNSIYPNFCRAVDSIAKICHDCGANVIRTVKFEQRWNENERDETDLKFLIEDLRYWSRRD